MKKYSTYTHAELVEKVEFAQKNAQSTENDYQEIAKELKRANKEIERLKKEYDSILQQRNALAYCVQQRLGDI